MPDVPPSEWHPVHRLDNIQVVLRRHEDDCVTLTIIGRSDTKRTSLWLYELGQVEPDPLEISDHLAHVIVCALQDTPNTQPRLDFSLSGGLEGGEDQPLF